MPFISAVDFSFDVSTEGDLFSSITVFLSVATEGSYDVKIFLEQNEEEIDSEVETESRWKNSYFYIQDIYFKEKSFRLRQANSELIDENIYVCVRLRDANSTSTPKKKCLPIKEEEVRENRFVAEDKNESVENIIEEPDSFNDSPVILNSKKAEKTIIYTTEGKKRIIVNILVAVLAMILLFLIVTDRI